MIIIVYLFFNYGRRYAVAKIICLRFRLEHILMELKKQCVYLYHKRITTRKRVHIKVIKMYND